MNFTTSKYTYKPMLLYVMLAILYFVVEGCEPQKIRRSVEPAFYYWKSVLNITDFELKKLDSLKVKTLYVKFFDVGWDKERGTSVPIAKLQSTTFKLPQHLAVIPTIFITNECIEKLDSQRVLELVDNILILLKEVSTVNSILSFKEIQIDCDWTGSTKSNYFLLLEKLNTYYKKLGITISCTIRLHQIKFLSNTGIPPVTKGLLMCYNMGNLKNPATNNSIIENEELKKYTATLSTYPLPLDVALPLFNWKVLFRNNSYAGLIESLPTELLQPNFAVKNSNKYTILKDTILNGYTFKKGDILRDEQSNNEEVLKAAKSISRQLTNTAPRVSLYHLDSIILSKYQIHELETIYNSLR
jgi:hypothetical protein